MFASLGTQSPPLSYFPASQRVAYLYFLGRYLFANNLFYPALIALQESYDKCHRQALQQKRNILTYLIPCNMIMGRFPSQELLERPECRGIRNQFTPICRLIIRGDYIAFREYLAIDSPNIAWLARKGLLLPLRNRCETLVWRSLCRKVFIYGGFHGDPHPHGRAPPPYLYLSKLEAAVKWIQSLHGINERHLQVIYAPLNPDFTDDDNVEERIQDYIFPDEYFDAQGGLIKNDNHIRVDGSLDNNYASYELDPYAGAESLQCLQDIESILSSLLTQGLMGGFLTHNHPRLAIPGAKLRGVLPTGFPNVWQTISAREREDAHVPGWVKPRTNDGGGRVVNLQGARPVGVQ